MDLRGLGKDCKHIIRMFVESLVVLRVKRAYFEFVDVSSIRFSESSFHEKKLEL